MRGTGWCSSPSPGNDMYIQRCISVPRAISGRAALKQNADGPIFGAFGRQAFYLNCHGPSGRRLFSPRAGQIVGMALFTRLPARRGIFVHVVVRFLFGRGRGGMLPNLTRWSAGCAGERIKAQA